MANNAEHLFVDTLLGGLSIQVLRSLSLNKSEPLTMPLCTSISSRPQSQPVCSLLRAFVHMASLAWYTLLPWWFFLLFSARCHFLTGIFLYPPSLRSSAHTLPTHHIISYSGISFAAIVNVTTISHCLFVGFLFVFFFSPQTRVSQPFTVNIWSWIMPCHGDCPHHYRMVSSSPRPSLTRCQYHAHSCTNHKLVDKRPKITWLRTTTVNHRHPLSSWFTVAPPASSTE